MIANPTIFVVDDDPIYLKLLHFSLNSEFKHIKTFKSGESLLQYVYGVEEPDIVVTDFNLEGISGLQVLKEIKRIRKTIKVIFFTGQNDVKNAINAVKLGAYDYIVKGPGAYKKLNKSIRDISKAEEKFENLNQSF